MLDRNGVKFEFELLTNTGNKIRENIMELVRDDLGKIGIVVKPRKLEFTVLVDTTRNKRFDAYVGGFSVGTQIDPKTMFHTTSIDAGFNRVGFSDLRADELIETGRAMADYKAAKPLWDEFQEIIHREQPWTFICEPFALNALNKRFRNVENNSLNVYQNLAEWTLPIELRN